MIMNKLKIIYKIVGFTSNIKTCSKLVLLCVLNKLQLTSCGLEKKFQLNDSLKSYSRLRGREVEEASNLPLVLDLALSRTDP